jgi:hypothetical protein
MNISVGTFIAIACQGEVGTGIENTVAPSLSAADYNVGTTVTVDLGDWTGATALAGSLRYVSDDTEIDTFTADGTYLLLDADFGEELYLYVVPDGNAAAAAASAAVGPVAFADAFTRADGAAGNGWSGGAVVGNALVITPSEGSEIISSNPGFETYTGTIDDASADTFTGWSLDNGTGGTAEAVSDAHGGSAALKLTDGGANRPVAFRTFSPTLGRWYLARAWTKVDSGGRSRLALTNGIVSLFESTSTTYELVPITGVGVSGTATFNVYRISGAAKSAYWDDTSAVILTQASLFALQTGLGAADIAIQAAATITGGTQAGVVLNLDSAATPANFVLGYYHRGDGKVYLDKYVGGTRTNLIATTAAYVAGATVRVVKNGTTYQLFYNNVQIGTDQTISDAGIISNTIHGLFSTYSGNTLDTVTITNP